MTPQDLLGASAVVLGVTGFGLLFKALVKPNTPAKPAFMDLEESADHASAVAETAYSSLLRERMIANLTAQLAKATKNKQAVRPLRARLAALQGRS